MDENHFTLDQFLGFFFYFHAILDFLVKIDEFNSANKISPGLVQFRDQRQYWE